MRKHGSFCMVLAIVMCIMAVSRAVGGPPGGKPESPVASTSPAPKQVDAVMEILAKHCTEAKCNHAAATEGLVAKGKDVLPVLLELQAHPDRLVREKEPKTLIDHRAGVVDAAAVRLDFGFDPVAAITKWGAQQKDAFGQPLKLRAAPKRLADARVSTVLPDYLIYTVHFSPFMGAPAAWPAHMGPQHCVFSVYRKGGVGMIDDKNVEDFFRKAMAMVKTPQQGKDALAVWLMVVEHVLHLPFVKMEIDVGGMAAEREKNDKGKAVLRVTGKNVVKKQGGDSGQIDAEMTFDADGKLTKATYQNNVKIEQRPMPPAAVGGPAK